VDGGVGLGDTGTIGGREFIESMWLFMGSAYAARPGLYCSGCRRMRRRGSGSCPTLWASAHGTITFVSG
jgi:hypothetical protein